MDVSTMFDLENNSLTTVCVIWNLQFWTKVSSLDLVEWFGTIESKEYRVSLREIEEWERDLLGIRCKIYFPPSL